MIPPPVCWPEAGRQAAGCSLGGLATHVAFGDVTQVVG